MVGPADLSRCTKKVQVTIASCHLPLQATQSHASFSPSGGGHFHFEKVTDKDDSRDDHNAHDRMMMRE